jgi:hypothetical protein
MPNHHLLFVYFKKFFFKGFFTSLIYFYFNTEIRYEVLRQIQRTLLSNDTVRRSSAGDTLSTRLSVFRISMSRHRHSSIPNRNEKRRTTNTFSPTPVLKTRQICGRKFLAFICPCLWNKNKLLEQEQTRQRPSIEQINQQNETSPATSPNLLSDDDLAGVTDPLLVQSRLSKGTIDNDGLTCDTVLIKHGIDYDELLSDENDVTFHQTSFTGEQTSSISNHTPLPIRNNINNQPGQSNSDEQIMEELPSKDLVDNELLR